MDQLLFVKIQHETSHVCTTADIDEKTYFEFVSKINKAKVMSKSKQVTRIQDNTGLVIYHNQDYFLASICLITKFGLLPVAKICGTANPELFESVWPMLHCNLDGTVSNEIKYAPPEEPYFGYRIDITKKHSDEFGFEKVYAWLESFIICLGWSMLSPDEILPQANNSQS